MGEKEDRYWKFSNSSMRLFFFMFIAVGLVGIVSILVENVLGEGTNGSRFSTEAFIGLGVSTVVLVLGLLSLKAKDSEPY